MTPQEQIAASWAAARAAAESLRERGVNVGDEGMAFVAVTQVDGSAYAIGVEPMPGTIAELDAMGHAITSMWEACCRRREQLAGTAPPPPRVEAAT